MIPNNITKEHVIKAIEDIDTNGLRYPLGASSVYDLVYKNKKYPPKHVIVVANEYANGQLLSHLEFTTKNAQRFLTKLGSDFQIEQKSEDSVKKMIESYKEDLIEKGLTDEVYKWEMLGAYGGRPDIDSADFGHEVREIDYRNLIFHNGIAVRNHLVVNNAEQYRQAFKLLFNEEILLSERIVKFQSDILSVYRTVEEKLHHHHDERSIATFLTVKYPERYAFYKNSFYTKYCRMIGVKPMKKNEKYVHYLQLIDDFVKMYIAKDLELLELVEERLPKNVYKDENHKLLAQDILYKMLDKNQITFKGLINDLKEAISEEDSVLKDFTFDNSKFKDNGFSGKKDSFIWIRDAQKVIGNVNAHYEVSVRSRGRAKNHLFVDVHFEGKDKYKYRKIIGEALPEKLEWIPWQGEASIGHKEGIPHTDEDVIEKIIDQLLYIEDNIGNVIRTIMSQTYEVYNKDSFNQVKHDLNQILYGPPGTGKTYHTIEEALKIVDRHFYEKNKQNRTKLTTRFNDLLIKDFDSTNGQVAFCTFHQSLSYEDFIEGIKPVAPKGTEDAVNYKVTDGIFKKICLEATKTKSLSGFDEVYDQFINDVVENENTLVLYTPKLTKPFNIRINSNHNVVAIPQTEVATEMVITRTMLMNYMINNVVDDWKSYTIAISDYIKSTYPFTLENKDNSSKNYVLIIDEINRGNVSQVFGELITLIEEDKRLGNKEQLEVILPYSSKSFSVPKNLHIIGTMNTADRSIEALDTALRRRFSFKEMPSVPDILSPQHMIWRLWWAYEDKPWHDAEFAENERNLYDLLGAGQLKIATEAEKESIWKRIKEEKQDQTVFDNYSFNGFSFVTFLKTINSRLEKLLSSDHTVGHSYFMSVYTVFDLQCILYNKIIPLLQEYFYGDLGKIGLVLGKGFIKIKEKNKDSIFAEFDYDVDHFNEKDVYEILDYRKTENLRIEMKKTEIDVGFMDAIKILLGEAIIEK